VQVAWQWQSLVTAWGHILQIGGAAARAYVRTVRLYETCGL